MSAAWTVVVGVGLATMAIKAAGPVLLGGRPLPWFLSSVASLAGPALLAALVAINTFGAERALTLDARVVGVAAAAIALWRRAPLLLVVAIAAAATAVTRALAA
jgi:hypothetical protein